MKDLIFSAAENLVESICLAHAIYLWKDRDREKNVSLSLFDTKFSTLVVVDMYQMV